MGEWQDYHPVKSPSVTVEGVVFCQAVLMAVCCSTLCVLFLDVDAAALQSGVLSIFYTKPQHHEQSQHVLLRHSNMQHTHRLFEGGCRSLALGGFPLRNKRMGVPGNPTSSLNCRSKNLL